MFDYKRTLKRFSSIHRMRSSASLLRFSDDPWPRSVRCVPPAIASNAKLNVSSTVMVGKCLSACVKKRVRQGERVGRGGPTSVTFGKPISACLLARKSPAGCKFKPLDDCDLWWCIPSWYIWYLLSDFGRMTIKTLSKNVLLRINLDPVDSA